MSPAASHRPCAGAYGTPARKLASFAGILFAHEILNVSDLRSCVDQLRTKPSCVALQSLHDLLRYAGDKSCKSKNREFMGELGVEQANRSRLPEFLPDHGAQILISVSGNATYLLSLLDLTMQNLPGDLQDYIKLFHCADKQAREECKSSREASSAESIDSILEC